MQNAAAKAAIFFSQPLNRLRNLACTMTSTNGMAAAYKRPQTANVHISLWVTLSPGGIWPAGKGRTPEMLNLVAWTQRCASVMHNVASSVSLANLSHNASYSSSLPSSALDMNALAEDPHMNIKPMQKKQVKKTPTVPPNVWGTIVCTKPQSVRLEAPFVTPSSTAKHFRFKVVRTLSVGVGPIAPETTASTICKVMYQPTEAMRLQTIVFTIPACCGGPTTKKTKHWFHDIPMSTPEKVQMEPLTTFQA
mmetsp:Transcript_101151/g.291214  ORF Transcript_101151/g.291214 Transcript_101151/m.291214 type:complete len:250 (-) Transcript_101151:84-833(-)